MRSIFTPLTLAFAVAGSPLLADTASISVTGQGQVNVAPDMARINLGVLNTADTANEAVAGMSSKISAILSTLASTGLPETDIQTSSLRVNPIQDYNNSTGRSRITGYSAQSTISVRITDLETLGEILDRALSDGANQLNGLHFDVADRAPHLDAARRLAVADAMSKAGVFTEAAGASLGGLLSISEAGAQPTPVMMEMSMARDAGVPVAAGDISISASVTMIYAIEDN